jgi:rhodanese-related sulfurtransferase/8-oxo-dGTP pyrophosphatase MutT (NUDIX family)
MGTQQSNTATPAELELEYHQMCTGYDQKTKARSITAEEALEKVSNNPSSVYFLDTREATEHQVSCLPSASLLVPSIGMLSISYKSTLPDVTELADDITIICCCTAGLRSGYAAVDLEKKWNRPVYSLKGGIIAWSNAGGTLQLPSGKRTERVHCYSEKWGKFLKDKETKAVYASTASTASTESTPTKSVTDDDATGQPPYCCVILHEEATGVLLMEDRIEATVASGSLCCVGGKREQDELAIECIRREAKEELGITLLEDELQRTVNLYVDGTLTAYFYVCSAPPRDALLVFETGRSGVWLTPDDAENNARISPWHQCVLQAWRKNNVRADFVS